MQHAIILYLTNSYTPDQSPAMPALPTAARASAVILTANLRDLDTPVSGCGGPEYRRTPRGSQDKLTTCGYSDLRIRQPLWPPKPNELFITTDNRASRAWFAT